MLVAMTKAVETLAEGVTESVAERVAEIPKKKGAPKVVKAKKTVKDSKPMVKMSRGKVAIDREALKGQIKRIKLATNPSTEEPEKDAKAVKAPKIIKFAKGTISAKPRGRPPGSLNKKTLARNMPAESPQMVA